MITRNSYNFNRFYFFQKRKTRNVINMSLLDIENRVTNLNDEFFFIQYSNLFFFNRNIFSINTIEIIATIKRCFEKIQTQLNQVNTKLTIKNLKIQIAQIKIDMFIRFAFVIATQTKLKLKFLKFNTSTFRENCCSTCDLLVTRHHSSIAKRFA